MVDERPPCPTHGCHARLVRRIHGWWCPLELGWLWEYQRWTGDWVRTIRRVIL